MVMALGSGTESSVVRLHPLRPMKTEEFKAVVARAMKNGIRAEDMADAFSVSVGTIDRWKRGQVVPAAFVRGVVTYTLDKMLREKITPPASPSQ